MNTRNPKIDGVVTSVQTLLDNMKKDDPQEFRVVGTVKVPDWRGVNNQFQGIAPINGPHQRRDQCERRPSVVRGLP